MSPRERLGTARLYLVCDARPREWLRAAVRGGVEVLQLRDKTLGDDGLVEAAHEFRAAGALFILNDRPDLVEACGADGVHVGQDDTPVAAARRVLGPEHIIGLSTHSAEQIAEACSAAPEARPDYISVGPIWETPTKQGRPGTGLGLIEHAARRSTLPWFAIGGIDTTNVGDVVAAGAGRIVVVRAVRDADDPRAAAAALREAVDAGTEEWK